MTNKILLSLFLLVTPCLSYSQIFPAEGSSLNYRIAGFAFPTIPKSDAYRIDIAQGRHIIIDSFEKNIIKHVETSTNKEIIELPAFGKQYTWRITYKDNKKVLKNSSLYHFSTLMNDRIDTAKFRLRILHAAEQHKDDYVSEDGGGVLYDMKGRPVWFIPDTNGMGGYVADLKFTKNGTITFIYKTAFEINYDGTILWKGPNNGSINGDTAGEYYHHEFTRLSNNHYLILGTQLIMCKTVTLKDTSYVLTSLDRSKLTDGYKPGRFGTIIEYDETGKVVWSWKFTDHLAGSDFDYYESRIDSGKRYDPHDNAFYFDEKNKIIYLGYRNLNRIMKIEYPSGKILNNYGENFKPGTQSTGKGLFCNQHSIGMTEEGYLYVFNNNSCQLRDSMPSIVILKEPVSKDDDFKKIWEYTCTMDTIDFPAGYPKIFGNGGNAIELSDHSFFVDMGSIYSREFIVNRAKKVLWAALPERYIETDGKWTALKNYRANIISRKDLEQLIWKSETYKP